MSCAREIYCVTKHVATTLRAAVLTSVSKTPWWSAYDFHFIAEIER
jgi:hypothetical protein